MKQLTLLYLVREGEVLLALKKRGVGAGYYNGVGGKVEPGENAEQAALRECFEEILVHPKNYYKTAELVFDEIFQGKRDLFNIHAFVCKKWGGTPKETEEMRPKWFKISNLPLGKMWPADRLWLPDVLSGKKLFGKFVLDDNDQVASKNVKIVKDLA